MTTTATRQVRVASRHDEAEGNCSFKLVAVDGHPLPAFTAGAHIDVHVPEPGGGTLVRPYSLYAPPDPDPDLGCACYRIAVLREPASRGGSAGMHDLVREGTVLTVGEPRNLFPLAPQATHHLLMAGGIGITPLLSMAGALASQGASFTLHYAARSRARMAFAEHIGAAPIAASSRLHLDDGEPAQRLDIPGVISAAPSGTHLYVCGPRGFIDAVLGAARQAQWPDERLHVESFSAQVEVRDADAEFEVVVASRGLSVLVPRGCTVAQALAQAGIAVPTSCEQGICGTCLTRVIDGTPDHRDAYLTPEEQAAGDLFTPCCSRSLSARLVLDL